MKKMEIKKRLRVPYALAVHDDRELRAVTRIIKSHKTLLGKSGAQFEKKIAQIFGKKYGIMVNSGSSANLLAVEILNLPEGSEVITPILTFATVLSPLVQKRLTPVFVDVGTEDYQANLDQVEASITKKTRALMIPSLFGNIPDMRRLQQIARKHNLYFIEDSCDTLGATFQGKPTGSYSHISTTSFYGPHIITAAGGGGMICVDDPKLARAAKILRGWGRSSAVTESEDIKKRYSVTLSGIPYDAKFTFEALGYNFLPLEISAAFGLAQLSKLKRFTRIRKRNFTALLEFFRQYEDLFILPKQRKDVETNWLAFPLTIRPKAQFSRIDIVKYLEERNIQTRPLFSGNIMRHPAFKTINARLPYRFYTNADFIMQNSFLIGCHHGMEQKHLDYVKEVFYNFLEKYR